MPYIGQQPTSVAFLTDQFSGNGSTTAFTLSAAPAGTSSILVAISGVVQDPSTYSVVGTTLTFSPAPPSGTGNISVRFLGIPASGVTTTAYRTVTEFTATAGQTTFTPPSYTPGFIDVYRNGVMLGSADYTASNGVSVVLALGATAGDLVEVISFAVSSVLNAIPSSPSSVGTTNLVNSSVTMAKLDSIAQYTGFKNRIINGDMTIDQRNAGASVTPANGGADYIYTLDRWRVFSSANSKFSIQQNAGSVTPPTGFSNYIGVTSLAATSVGSTDLYLLSQRIEGFNFADMSWGTAGASTITLSFWVRSSLTGAFGGALQNSALNRSYPFSYTINSANTWEYETITIAGDTTGTWVGATNGVGCTLQLGLGVGSSFSGTAGSWSGSNLFSATGATSVVGTSGATFYITGVQLEKGNVATSFDYLPYTTELALCQRYYEKSFALATAPANAQFSGSSGGGTCIGFTSVVRTAASFFKVTKRAIPTITIFSSGNPNNVNGQWQFYNAASGNWGSGATNAQTTSENYVSFDVNAGSGLTTNSSYIVAGDYTASAEL